MPFHVTPKKNLSNIRECGLTPAIGPRSESLGEEREAVYLFPTLDDAEHAWMNWLGEQFDEDEQVAILEVVVPGDAQLLETVDYEIVVLTPIPASLCTVLNEDIDDFDFQSPVFTSPGLG